MKLGTKINFVLVVVIAITLTLAFWIIIGIEGKNLKKQVISDTATVTDILKLDIERMFSQIHKQELYLQDTIDRISKTSGVRYVNVSDAESKYIAATDRSFVGKKVSENELAIISEVKNKRKFVDIKIDEGTFYSLERFVPIFVSAEDPTSRIANVIEVVVNTHTKSASDISEAEKLLQVIVASIEQNTRAIILTYNDDLVALQQITDSVVGFDFFHNFIIYNDQMEVIASTGASQDHLEMDSAEEAELRHNVLSGKIATGELGSVRDGKQILLRVIPITSTDDKTGKVKNIGLVEVHILEEVYKERVSQLTVRMFGVGVIFTATLVIVLALILDRKVVGPIRRYSVVARKIADGDLSQSVEPASNDEIGQFGDVFNSMVQNLRELDKLKSDFTSVAAHQLRTPLSGVKWVLKLLLDGDLGETNEDQKGMLKRGYDTNEKMIQLVNDLLNVSRIENGKFGYKFEKNDFMKLLKTLIENTELSSRERKIEVRLENHVGIIPNFPFDPEKLLIAFQNIVDNAMKYTLPGGSVTITLEKRGDYIEVKVIDTGVGIPKADMAKLFSKFFRAANVIHLQTDGSGLGLFIVKSIIMRHGGQIWVDSVEGKGTTFTVVIPLTESLIPTDDENSKLDI